MLPNGPGFAATVLAPTPAVAAFKRCMEQQMEIAQCKASQGGSYLTKHKIF